MSASTSRPHFQPSQSEYFASEFLAALDVEPDDRIGRPRGRRVGRLVAWSTTALGLAAAGYLHYDDPSRWPRWWSEATTIAAPLIERIAAATPPAAGGPNAARRLSEAPPDSGTLAPRDARSAAAPAAAPSPAEPTSPAAPTATDTATAVAAPPVERTIAPPPAVAAVEIVQTAPRKDSEASPNQARARAAGLNPDISRAVLDKLSETDFRNAKTAIQKALSGTADDDVLYWPAKVKPGVAQFQVHFVPGAAADCRRYVVTVAKDGWATTALPMDNCSVKLFAKARTN